MFGGSFNMVVLVLKGGATSFHSKGGAMRKGGGQKVWGPRFSHFVSPLHIINGRSLMY